MPLDLSFFANDFRQVANDLPVSFRFRKVVYTNASFNPGGLEYDAVNGGIVEGMTAATLMYAVADLPKREARMNELIEVLWHGDYRKFRIMGAVYGFAVATFPLEVDEKG